MANGTKASKLRKYFEKNPDATTKQAAEWANCSYGNAYAIKQEFCKKKPKASSEAVEKRPQGWREILKAEPTPAVSDGSTASYYELPEGATELQDLISHKNMNAQVGEIFRAAYRYGESSHSNELRDAKKIKFYIDAEIKRLGG